MVAPQVGPEIIQTVFGKRMHGISGCRGGAEGTAIEERDRFLNGDDGIPSMAQVMEYAHDGLQVFYDFHEKHRAEVDSFAVVPALSMSLVDEDGNVDYYHGRLRVTDENKRVVDEFDYHDYLDHFAEGVELWSYMKFPFLKALGREAGSVRVGSLARMNVTETLPTKIAADALEGSTATRTARRTMTLHSNWARAIEIIHAVELIEELLLDPDLQSDDLVRTRTVRPGPARASASSRRPRDGAAPLRADEEGAMTFANLIVATTQNNEVLNRTVRAVAEEHLSGKVEVTEGMMNAIEVGIRAYDPCLSCATHALGQMPLVVSVFDAGGSLVQEKAR